MQLMPMWFLAAALSLGGCATSSNFADAMEGGVKSTKNASQIVDNAQRDFIHAQALGAVDRGGAPEPTIEILTCYPVAGLSAAGSNLAVFSDGTDLVAKVAKKPDDITYGGYIAALKADRQAVKDANDGDLLKVKGDAIKAAQRRCELALIEDLRADSQLKLPAAQLRGANVIAVILGLDKVFKTLLSDIESAEREAAVRASVNAIIPRMEDAKKELASTYNASFGPVVQLAQGFPPGVTKQVDKEEVTSIHDMNGTVLGATITMERWYVAHTIEAIHTQLATCRASKKSLDCLADPQVRANLDAMTNAIATYRALAQVDSKKLLIKLENAIADARKASDTKLPGLLEAISTVANAFSDLADAVDKYKKAKGG